MGKTTGREFKYELLYLSELSPLVSEGIPTPEKKFVNDFVTA